MVLFYEDVFLFVTPLAEELNGFLCPLGKPSLTSGLLKSHRELLFLVTPSFVRCFICFLYEKFFIISCLNLFSGSPDRRTVTRRPVDMGGMETFGVYLKLKQLSPVSIKHYGLFTLQVCVSDIMYNCSIFSNNSRDKTSFC